MANTDVDYRIPVRLEHLIGNSELSKLARATGAIVQTSITADGGNGPFRKKSDEFHLDNVPTKKPATEPQTAAEIKAQNAKTLDENCGTLQSFADTMTRAKGTPVLPENWHPKAVADGQFKFRKYRTVADCTAFVVGDHIIAGAAHTIFGNKHKPGGTIASKVGTLDKWQFILSVTADNVDLDEPVMIPEARVYEFDRILYGEYYPTNDAQIPDANGVQRDKVIGRDELDWVLVKLKPNNHGFPDPLVFRDNGPTLAELAGDKRVVSAGHSWFQSLKFEDAFARPPPNQTRIYTHGDRMEAAPASPLRFSFLHNILLQPGHSGGPVMVHDMPQNSFRVIGVQGGTEGLDNKTRWGQRGLRYDDATDSVHLIEPATREEKTRFCIATRTEVFEHLLRPQAMVRIYYKSRPTVKAGVLDIYLRILSRDGSSIYCHLLKRALTTDTTKTVENAISVPYSSLEPAAIVPPAHIVGAFVAWTPTDVSAKPFPGKPDLMLGNPKVAERPDPIGVPIQSRRLAALGIAIHKDFGASNSGGDFRQVARSTLFYTTFEEISGTSSSDPHGTAQEVLEIGFHHRLTKESRLAMDTALGRLSG